MSIIKKFKRLFANSDGQVLVIVALLIVGIVGMIALVTDMGSLYEDRRSLQGAADAAALAGAQELPDTSAATQEAENNISKNYEDDNFSVDIQFNSFKGEPNTMITVTISNPDSSIIFGGVSSANVSASATAIVGKPKNLSNVVPWGVKLDPGEDWKEWVSKQTEKTLKYGPQSDEKIEGNFYALDLDPNAPHPSGGENDYYSRIVDGYNGDLKVGDIIWTEPGVGGKTGRKVDERLEKYGDGTIHDFDVLVKDGNLIVKNGQFVMVPVIYTLVDPTGQEQVEILAFAPFIITKVITSGSNKGEVKGKFVSQALVVNEGSVDLVEGLGIKEIGLIK